MNKKDEIVGMLWATAAVGLFSIIYVSGRLTNDIVAPIVIVWLRYVGGFVVILLIAFATRKHQKLFETKISTHFARFSAGGLGTLLILYAASKMPVVNVTAIGLLDGFFVVLLALIVLSERIAAKTTIAMIVCAAGSFLIIYEAGLIQNNDLFPVLVAVLGAFCLALELVIIKHLADTEDRLKTLVWVNGLGATALLIPSLPFISADHVAFYLIFLMLGPVALLGQFCNIVGCQHSSAAVIGATRYNWIIFAIFWGFFVFDEKISSIDVLGIGVMLVGASLLSFERKMIGKLFRPLPKRKQSKSKA